VPVTVQIDQRDTHRLIPAQYAEGGASVLTRLTDDGDLLDGIFELDNATNDRLLAEWGIHLAPPGPTYPWGRVGRRCRRRS